MGSVEQVDPAAAFAEELLRAGCVLSDLAGELVEELPDDAYPGEDPAAVVVEMVIGSICSAFGAADRRDLERATELIVAACDRVLEHLRLALELSRRMGKAGNDGPARAYG